MIQIPTLTKISGTTRSSKQYLKSKTSSQNLRDEDFGEVDDNEGDLEDKIARRKNLKFHVTRLDQQIAKRAARKRLVGGEGDADIPKRDKYGRLVDDGKKAGQESVEGNEGIDDSWGTGADDCDKADGDAGGFDPTALDDIDLDDVDLGDLDEFDADPGARNKRKLHSRMEESEDDTPESYYESVKASKKAKKEARERILADSNIVEEA